MTTESVYWISINNVWRVIFYYEWRDQAIEGKFTMHTIYSLTVSVTFETLHQQHIGIPTLKYD